MQLTHLSSTKAARPIHKVVRSMVNDLKAAYTPSMASPLLKSVPIVKPTQPALSQSNQNYQASMGPAPKIGNSAVTKPAQRTISFQMNGPLFGILSIVDKMLKGEPMGNAQHFHLSH